jgi:hypothetical protein
MNERKGTVIRVDFFVPTANVDEAYQEVHKVIEDAYTTSVCDIYDTDEGQWFYGSYDVDTNYRQATFEVDDEGSYVGLIDIDSEVTF